MATTKRNEPQFGDIPLKVFFNGEAYSIDMSETADIEDMGLLQDFPPEQLHVMEARALAHGYKLVVTDTREEGKDT